MFRFQDWWLPDGETHLIDYLKQLPSYQAAQREASLRHVKRFGTATDVEDGTLTSILAWRSDSLTTDLAISSVITSVIMAVVGVVACAVPARRVMRVQPTDALRQD